MRGLRRLLLKDIAADLRRGMTMAAALYSAGETLLAASQNLVPVRTGVLKASGYVSAQVTQLDVVTQAGRRGSVAAVTQARTQPPTSQTN